MIERPRPRRAARGAGSARSSGDSRGAPRTDRPPRDGFRKDSASDRNPRSPPDTLKPRRGGPPRVGSEVQRPALEVSPHLLIGINPVLEALRRGLDRVERLFIQDGALNRRIAGEILSRASSQGVRVERVDRKRLDALANDTHHQGVVAVVREYEYLELHELVERAKAEKGPPLLVVLDGIQDPHNLGAIIRSAHALGAHGVVIGRDRAAPVTSAVARASAGAVEHCPVAQVVNVSRALEDLKAAGLWVAAADPAGERALWDVPSSGPGFTEPLALVVGSEGWGVREGVLKHCDFRVRIPLHGPVGSLNASVSAAVVLAEIARQRALARQAHPYQPS